MESSKDRNRNGNRDSRVSWFPPWEVENRHLLSSLNWGSQMVSAKQTTVNSGFLATLDPLSSLKKKKKSLQSSIVYYFSVSKQLDDSKLFRHKIAADPKWASSFSHRFGFVNFLPVVPALLDRKSQNKASIPALSSLCDFSNTHAILGDEQLRPSHDFSSPRQFLLVKKSFASYSFPFWPTPYHIMHQLNQHSESPKSIAISSC